MISRYETPFMAELFSEENKLRTWVWVEIAFLKSLVHFKKLQLDTEVIARLEAKAQAMDWQQFKKIAHTYEQDSRHDVIAFVQTLGDVFGQDGRFLHFGLTSSDIVDSAFAVTLKKACDAVSSKLRALIESLFVTAKNHQGVLCLGRTHGQAAEPITFGIKLLTHQCEFLRSYQRLQAATKDVAVGKLSGAVGVYNHVAPEVEAYALSLCGIHAETCATQVVARDRHSALLSTLAVLGGSIERLATEIRLLMHGEIQEVAEPFYANQKGSSAMPHKKNPVLSENLCGLMRLMRSYALAALENQALWHERDISHSSVERVIVPDAFKVMDFALGRLTEVVSNLSIDSDRMKKNLHDVSDRLYSQAFLLALINKGVARTKAYELIQKASFGAATMVKENLLSGGIDEYLSEQEIETIFAQGQKVEAEDMLFARVNKLMGEVLGS